jgi:hypothetical protein
VTVIGACFETPPYDAVTVTCVGPATFTVDSVNLADVAPAGTVTLAGAVTAGFELARVTIAPPAGAGPVRETEFQVEEVPPTVDAANSDTVESAGGTTEIVPVLVTPP